MFLASDGKDEIHDLIPLLDGSSVNSFAFTSDSLFSDSLFSRCSYDTDSVFSSDVCACFSSPSVVSDSLSEMDSAKEGRYSCDERDQIPNIALPPLPERELTDSTFLIPHSLDGAKSNCDSEPEYLNTRNTLSEQNRLCCKQR